MSRWLRAALSLALVVTVYGVTRGQDAVLYTDRATKKEARYTGTIEDESPAGIKIKVKEGKETVTRAVPTPDIVSVQYQTKDIDKLTFRAPFAKEERGLKAATPKERTKLLTEALDGFTKLESQLASQPQVRRYVQFKVAELTAHLAQDDPTRADSAIKLLTDFKTAHPTSWQLFPALKTLARLLEDTGRSDDARKAYEELTDLPDAPADLKLESGVLVARLLLRGGKYADAQKRLEKLMTSLSRESPFAPFVRAYLVESQMGQDNLGQAVQELTDVIRTTSDPRAKAVAYNLLGDFYRKKGDLESAFWQYLRTDAMYNEDAEEQAKALFFLANLFDKVKKDPLRGKECLGRLQEQRFAGTAYQRQAAREAKPPESK
ncbi:MAG: tetratricopeptide repeat protein [Gemmataceae bacterium]